MFDTAFSKFESEINQLKLGNKKTDTVIKIIKNLCEEQYKFTCSIVDADVPSELNAVVKKCLATSNSKLNMNLKEFDSAYKRKNRLLKCGSLVQPKEIAMGLKWRTKLRPDAVIPNHDLTQTTFQFVSVEETLKSLFRNPSFKKMYFDYNNHKHQCRDGIYENYCCSSVYKRLDIAQYKDAIIIQLGIDDFDVCCPVKSKVTIHKMTAIYFKIRNLPPEFDSKLDCIFLVALCETENMKGREACLNNIFELIRNELWRLESEGLQIDETTNLRAFLFNVTSDNLGENGALGFVECFSMDGMCRFCDMSKNEWKIATQEIESKLRTELCFRKAIDYIHTLEDDQSIDFKITNGIKSYCLLNDLRNFHVLQNVNVDVMHDIMEGLIPYFLENFFKYCSEKKVASYTVIQELIRDFNYGFLFKGKRPSKIKYTSSHLNQNATQLYTIMLHLPFIFKDYRNKLRTIENLMISLLQIMQILFSTTIHESDVQKLEQLIHQHLDEYQKVFKVSLSPKHHFVTHYPNVIRQMGPVIHTWMMRFEAKHKTLAGLGKRQCFKNIALTIPERHQI